MSVRLTGAVLTATCLVGVAVAPAGAAGGWLQAASATMARAAIPRVAWRRACIVITCSAFLVWTGDQSVELQRGDLLGQPVEVRLGRRAEQAVGQDALPHPVDRQRGDVRVDRADQPGRAGL